jgi:hypothetical protein
MLRPKRLTLYVLEQLPCTRHPNLADRIIRSLRARRATLNHQMLGAHNC